MSDTHAHTAKVQADVQTGKPHIPPGHLEGDRPTDQAGTRPKKPVATYVTAAAIALAVVVLALLFLA